MRRVPMKPRRNLDERATEYGFEFHNLDGAVYWDETAAYAFTLAEIERDIEDPTTELANLCLDLVAKVVGDETMLTRLRIPEHAWPLIADSWRREDKSLYGRFDLAYDGRGPAKLLEYNADTPTSLFEASVFQWVWLEDMIAGKALPQGSDQFNSIHEKVIERLKTMSSGSWLRSPRLHLACMMDAVEDRGLVAYLTDCAGQAGFTCSVLSMEDIGVRDNGPFVDLDDKPIELMFKLYPWEWIFDEAFGKAPSMNATRFVEPPWKAVLSNKAILPLLWEMAPGHPNLLPAFFDDDPRRAELGNRFARKPFYSREGANITLVDGDAVLDRDTGPYAYGGFVRQALVEMPVFDGHYAVVGSWVIGDAASGIGIREDVSRITKNTSRFVPHYIEA